MTGELSWVLCRNFVMRVDANSEASDEENERPGFVAVDRFRICLLFSPSPLFFDCNPAHIKGGASRSSNCHVLRVEPVALPHVGSRSGTAIHRLPY